MSLIWGRQLVINYGFWVTAHTFLTSLVFTKMLGSVLGMISYASRIWLSKLKILGPGKPEVVLEVSLSARWL